MTDLDKLLEEEVATFRQSMTLEAKCTISTAISLKRIADALTALQQTADIANLTNTVDQLAWAAGRSFEQGRRTDR